MDGLDHMYAKWRWFHLANCKCDIVTEDLLIGGQRCTGTNNHSSRLESLLTTLFACLRPEP